MTDSININDGAINSPHQRARTAQHTAFEQRITRTMCGTLERASWESCRRFGSTLGLLFFAGWKPRRDVAIKNAQLALGINRTQAARIARRASQNWGMTTCEFLHLPGATKQEIRDYVRLDGLEHLQGVLQEGKGAIVMTAHLGNWEVLAARLAQEIDLTLIVRPLTNPALTGHMTEVRRSKGLKVVSKHAGARPAARLLRNGEAIYILPDRHAGKHGALLPFFGRPTRFETAPVRLAVITQAPIVPVYGVRRAPWLADGRIEGRILPPLRVQARRDDGEAAAIEGTRQIIASIEDIVRQYPDQWSWMQRHWREDDLASADAPAASEDE